MKEWKRLFGCSSTRLGSLGCCAVLAGKGGASWLPCRVDSAAGAALFVEDWCMLRALLGCLVADDVKARRAILEPDLEEAFVVASRRHRLHIDLDAMVCILS